MIRGVIGGPSVTFNPYPYAQNNPVNMVDPNGEFAIPLLVFAAGTLLDAGFQMAFEGKAWHEVDGWRSVAAGASGLVGMGTGYVAGRAISGLGLTGVRAFAAGAIGVGADFGVGVAVDHYLLGDSMGTALAANVFGFGVGEVLGYASRGIGRSVGDDIDVNWIDDLIDNRHVDGIDGLSPQDVYNAVNNRIRQRFGMQGDDIMNNSALSMSVLEADGRLYLGLNGRSDFKLRKLTDPTTFGNMSNADFNRWWDTRPKFNGWGSNHSEATALREYFSHNPSLSHDGLVARMFTGKEPCPYDCILNPNGGQLVNAVSQFRWKQMDMTFTHMPQDIPVRFPDGRLIVEPNGWRLP